jgi:post-segregation antitoxin (ccd killing protein)
MTSTHTPQQRVRLLIDENLLASAKKMNLNLSVELEKCLEKAIQRRHSGKVVKLTRDSRNEEIK